MKTTLHIIEQLADYGGTPRVLLNLAAQHGKTTNKMVIATYMPSALQSQFEHYGVEVHNFNSLVLAKLIWKIVKLARRRGATVICTHHTRPLVIGYFVARLSGLPLLHHEHCSADYRKGLGNYLARICLPAADAVVCNSLHTAKTVIKAYKVAREKIHVLYNPVEKRLCGEDRLTIRRRIGVASDAIVIGHVGGMIETRDQATLIKAFQRYHSVNPNSYLVLIGDGPLRKDLEEVARKGGTYDAIRFIGYTDQVGDYLNAMDIYVNPTLDEGFGIAVVEAMMARIPVVLADAGAHPELIDEGHTGLLYPGGNAEALADLFFLLTREPALCNRMAVEAERAAHTRYTPARYAHDFENIMANVLAHHGKRCARAGRSVG